MPTSGRSQRRLVGGQAVAAEQREFRVALARRDRRRRTASAETGSRAGSQSSVSMPFRMPTRSARARAEDAVEPEAELRRLDFLGVARADGRDDVGVVDAAFQEADLAARIRADRRVNRSQPRSSRGSQSGVEEALIGEVVNREDAGRAAKHGMRRVERAQIDRREARLPVVRVDDGRRRAARAANSSAARTRNAKRRGLSG